ncbi:MAG: type II toxin-antitoxin system VapB family antitoxin [Agrobacterium sp.]|uniref:type II toxin-antitoxin system VapB family antitoxin n=1 Tax=Agrobacterium sp. TaxID=361 RepID=UPI0040347388
MRVTIDLDDALIAEIMEITGLSDAQEAVEKALREFVRIHQRDPRSMNCGALAGKAI